MNRIQTISYLISCAAIAAILGVSYLSFSETAYIKGGALPKNPSVQGIETPTQEQESEGLDLKLYSGEWGVYFKEVGQETLYDKNSDVVYSAASLNKLITAITILKKVDEGKLTLDTTIGRTSIQALLETMINRSDNDSWDTLNNLATFPSMQEVVKSLDLNNTSMFTNQTTADDMATLLQKLWTKKILSEKSTTLLLSLMQKTETEDRIPIALKSGIEVYHKTGSLDENALHDVAIIRYQDKTYVLVILGRKTTRVEGTRTIQEITRQLTSELP